MKHVLIVLLLLAGCSKELVRQRELLALSKLWAQKCKNDINNKTLCIKALSCIDSCQKGSQCYQDYRDRLIEGLDVEKKGLECSESYLEARKVCK